MANQDFFEFDKQSKTLFCKGAWNLDHITKIQRLIKKQKIPKIGEININGEHITELDSSGAWVLINAIKSLTGNEVSINLKSFSEQHQKLFFMLKKTDTSHKKSPKKDELNWIQKLGKYSLFQADELHSYLSFIGELLFDTLRILKNPTLWRWNSIISVINRSGAEALPIIALLSFTIGIVISYQMGNQLQKYGANVFIVDLLGLSILREFGPLLTAIMVGGRTGSAFTAQLGIMKINQEIDALTTMGVTPAELLLLPRIAGLFLVVPLLTIWSDLFGIMGGMMMAQSMLTITWHDFLIRFQHEVPLRSLIIGLGKAPVFALIISSVGCFEGMQVSGSAESVGMRTTRSVVLAIFFIIVFDGICSILLSKYKL